MSRFTQAIPLSLYIHLPWCLKKCPYCDFNSHTVHDELPETAYIDALIADLEQDLPRIWGRSIHTVFIGGGTPSLFSAASFARLLDALQARLRFNRGIEITLEANPGTAEQEKFKAYRDIGINRLSLGIQSLSDHFLKKLGRIHDAANAIAAIDCARQAGFSRLNCDLMYALPGQSTQQALADLSALIAIAPPHLSWYQLTIEPNTRFYHERPQLPNDEVSWEITTEGQALLQAHGYAHYEISAYAQHQQFCQHNLNYWQYGDYLGIGAGSHSKITDVANGTITRLAKQRHPKAYLNPETSFISQETLVTPDEYGFEFMLNHLRLYQPINEGLFHARTGLYFQDIQGALNTAADKDLLSVDTDTLALTDLGKRFYNDLVTLFLPDDK